MSSILRDSDLKPLDAFEEKITLTQDGWIVQFNGKRAILFNDILSIESNTLIADQLGITPMEAWALKNKLLEAWPQNLNDVRNLFGAIVREDSNIKLAILSLFSLKLKDRSERLMGIIILSPNSSGKSKFSKEILSPLKDDVIQFTRMTGPFLERYFSKQNIDRRILYLQELGSNVPFQLHLTLSEGMIRLGYVERKDGEFQPVEVIAEGQPFLWATNVEWFSSQDLLHRCLILNLDESEEQTEEIIKFQNKLSMDPIYRERFERFISGCFRIFYRLWNDAPSDVVVIIPYAEILRENIKVSRDVKLRRDWSKLLSLLKAAAILFHKHRPKLRINNNEIIVSTVDDLREVLPLFTTSFKTTLKNVSEKEEKIIECLKDGLSLTIKEIAQKTGLPSKTIRYLIDQSLEPKGFVICNRDIRPMTVELVKTPELYIDENLIKKAEEAVNTFLSSYWNFRLQEKTLEKGPTQEKELKEIPKINFRIGESFSDENKLILSSITKVENSKETIGEDDASLYLSVTGGGYPT
jgi:DNA-binding Lrp family transcriptional regulator